MTHTIGQAPVIPFPELQTILVNEKANGIKRLTASTLRGARASKGAYAVTDTQHWPTIDWGGFWMHGHWCAASPNPFRTDKGQE